MIILIYVLKICFIISTNIVLMNLLTHKPHHKKYQRRVKLTMIMFAISCFSMIIVTYLDQLS